MLTTVEVFLNARYGYDIRCEVVGENGTLGADRARRGSWPTSGTARGRPATPPTGAPGSPTPTGSSCRPGSTRWPPAPRPPLADRARRPGRDRRGRGRHHLDARRRPHGRGRGPRRPLSRRTATPPDGGRPMPAFPADASRPSARARPVDARPPCAGACSAPAGSPSASSARCSATPASRWSPSARATPSASRDFADRLGIAARHGSYEELVADPTSTSSTSPRRTTPTIRCALLALEAGKHVLVEKPIALNAAQARRSPRLAAAPRRVLHGGAVDVLPAEVRRDPPAARRRRARRGPDRARRPRRVVPRRPTASCAPTWPAAPLLDLGTYPLALAAWVLGEPEQVVAIGQDVRAARCTGRSRPCCGTRAGPSRRSTRRSWRTPRTGP